MADQRDRCTYDDVMLDWAVAELMSPTWQDRWAGKLCDELRQKVRQGGVPSLTVYERTWLVGVVCQIRAAIILVYGPCRSWTFRRASVPRAELERFSIISHFGRPSFSLGQLLAEVQSGEPARDGMRRDINAINADAARAPFGSPIAVVLPSPLPPLLVEGYKRSMAAILRGDLSVGMYLCEP